MSQTSTVLLTLSITVNSPVSVPRPEEGIDQVQHEFLNDVSERLMGFADQMAGEPWYEECYGVTFRYLTGDPDFVEQNVARCGRCNRWTTDVDLPNKLEQICFGSRFGDVLVCAECQRFAGDDECLNPLEG